MAQCKWCSRRGIFLSVDSNGLCGRCQPLIPEISSRIRVLRESLQLAENGKTYATRLSRCDLAMEHAEYLTRFEKAGVPTVEPGPSELLAGLRKHRSRLIDGEVEAIATKAKEKASLAATPRSRERALASAVLKIKELTDKAGADEGIATPHVQELHREVHRVKLDGFLEAARKAEFKGNSKKAIDQYQEALYCLRNDGIDDVGQAVEIEDVEAKLQELQAS